MLQYCYLSQLLLVTMFQSKRDAKHDCVKWELTIDPSLIESDNEMCWKQTKIPGRRSKYYRLVPTQHALSLVCVLFICYINLLPF